MSFSTSATPRRRPPRARGAAGALTPVAASAMVAPSSSLVPMTAAVPSSSLSNGVGPVPPSSLRVVSSYAPSQASDDGMDAVPSAPANQSLAGPGHDKVWVRDGRLEVWGKSDLPAEIEELLHDADLYTTSLSGALDPASGFASLRTPSYLFLWPYLVRASASTLYTFPLPPSSRPAHTVLVRHPGGREPGVLVVSAEGDVRLWEGVSSALVGGGERFVAGEVSGLAEGDEVANIHEIEPGLYIVSTSAHALHLLTISHPSGRALVSTAPFPRTTFSSSGSLLSRFFRSSPSSSLPSSSIAGGSDLSHPLAITLSVQKEIFTLSQRTLSRFRLSGRTPQLLAEQNLLGPLTELLGGEDSEHALSLETHDVEILSEARGELAVLVSFKDEGGGWEDRGRGEQRKFAVAVVRFGNAGTGTGDVEIVRFVRCEYKTDIDPRPLPSPRLFVSTHTSPATAETAFILTPSVILVVSLAEGRPSYEESIPLKDSARNAFLGVGACESGDHSASPNGAEIVVITKASGILGVRVIDLVPGQQQLERSAAATARLKTKLEQAVFYGDRPQNPLSFDLLAGYDGNLMHAAEQVSAEILASNSPSMPAILDLRSHIADRLSRLRSLIEFIGANGLLGKLSQSSRRRLAWDAEKLSASADLWSYQNARMGEASRSPKSLLADAIATVMSSYGFAPGEDVVRLFFRTRARDIGSVLDQVAILLRQAIFDSSGSTQSASKWLLEANRIFLIAFKAALRHGEAANAKYGIDRTETLVEPWSSTSSMIDAFDLLVTRTETIVHERSREFGSALDEEPLRFGGNGGSNNAAATASSSSIDGQAAAELSAGQAVQREFKEQLCELAGAMFLSFEERIRYLLTLVDNGNSDDREVIALSERYSSVRFRVILALVGVDRSEQAYTLAEHHGDYRALVELCNHQKVGSQVRIQYYIETFKEDFAFELYRWYIEKGQIKTLLTQDEIYGELLTKFFDKADHPRITWIHEIAVGQYQRASDSLLRESEKEPKLANQQLMLSIGKLCQMATIGPEGGDQSHQHTLDVIDDRLDLIGVHDYLRGLLQTAAGPTSPTEDPSATVERATASLTPNLADRPTLRALFKKLAGELLAGRTLAVEDLVDLLTLKANAGDEVSGFATALDVLRKSRNLPRGRADLALVTVWRRVFIRDDWLLLNSTQNLTDQALEESLRSTALYQTLCAVEDQSLDVPRLTPRDILLPSSSSDTVPGELSARFATSGKTPSELTSLWSDLRAEDAQLRGFLDEKKGGRLGVWAEEVARLMKERGATAEQEA